MNGTQLLHGLNVFLAGNLFYLLLGVLLVNMLQRRHQRHTARKRMATLYIGILVLALMCGTILIVHFGLPDLLLLPLLGALVLVGYRYREHVFPFRLHCASCGGTLEGKRILYYDSNRCQTCEPEDEA